MITSINQASLDKSQSHNEEINEQALKENDLHSVSTFRCLDVPIRGPSKPLYAARTPRAKDPCRQNY